MNLMGICMRIKQHNGAHLHLVFLVSATLAIASIIPRLHFFRDGSRPLIHA